MMDKVLRAVGMRSKNNAPTHPGGHSSNAQIVRRSDRAIKAPLHPVVGGHCFNVQTGTKFKMMPVKTACMTQNGGHVVAAVVAGKDRMDISVFKIEQGYKFKLIQTVKNQKAIFVSTFSSDMKYFVAGGSRGGEDDDGVELFEWDGNHETEPLKLKASGCNGLGKIDTFNGAICASPTNVKLNPAMAGCEPSFIAAGGDSGDVRVCLLPDVKTEVFPVQRRIVEPTQADADRKPSKVTSLAMAWQESDLLLAAGASDGKLCHNLAIYQFPFDRIMRAVNSRVQHVGGGGGDDGGGSAQGDDGGDRRESIQESTIGAHTLSPATFIRLKSGQKSENDGEDDGFLVCEITFAEKVSDASFSADGLKLVVASDRLIAIYDVLTGMLLHEVIFGRVKETINRVIFSPFGKNIVAAGGGKEGGRVEIYDVGTCALRRRIYRDGRVRMLQWSNGEHNEQRMFSAGDDMCLSLYDMQKNPYSMFPKLTHNGCIDSVAISNDSKWLAAGEMVPANPNTRTLGGTLFVYKLGPHSSASSFCPLDQKERVVSLSWAPNNCVLAVMHRTTDGNEVHVYRVSESESDDLPGFHVIKYHTLAYTTTNVRDENILFRPTPNAKGGERQILAVGGNEVCTERIAILLTAASNRHMRRLWLQPASIFRRADVL